MTNQSRALFVVVSMAGVVGCGDESSNSNLPDGPAQVDAAANVDAAIDASPDAPAACAGQSLRTDLTWRSGVRERLQAWIDARGCRGAGFDPAHPPVALFDWDNTVIKNDIGDAITFYLLEHDKVLQPPGQDWGRTSPYMTAAAQTALTSACGTEVPAGQPLQTTTDLDCTDEILSIYIDGTTRGGAPAFAGWNYRRMEPTYAWTAQLMAGYTPAEIKGFVAETVTAHLAAPVGATKVVGTRTVNAYIRVYDQIADLIATMQANEFDVWAISASPQPVVEVFAARVDIAADHVIGIRHMLDGAGRYTYHFQGCGPVADAEDSMISYIEGKRCWVNKVVYGTTGPTAMDRRPVDQRQVFGAGDSDTDIEFLRDATYKLALNRNKRELMCFAYRNEGDAWVVNPMFIAPRPQQATPYPCDTTACKNAAGVGGPCRDEAGAVIPPQNDVAF